MRLAAIVISSFFILLTSCTAPQWTAGNYEADDVYFASGDVLQPQSSAAATTTPQSSSTHDEYDYVNTDDDGNHTPYSSTPSESAIGTPGNSTNGTFGTRRPSWAFGLGYHMWNGYPNQWGWGVRYNPFQNNLNPYCGTMFDPFCDPFYDPWNPNPFGWNDPFAWNSFNRWNNPYFMGNPYAFNNGWNNPYFMGNPYAFNGGWNNPYAFSGMPLVENRTFNTQKRRSSAIGGGNRNQTPQESYTRITRNQAAGGTGERTMRTGSRSGGTSTTNPSSSTRKPVFNTSTTNEATQRTTATTSRVRTPARTTQNATRSTANRNYTRSAVSPTTRSSNRTTTSGTTTRPVRSTRTNTRTYQREIRPANTRERMNTNERATPNFNRSPSMRSGGGSTRSLNTGGSRRR